MFVIESAKFVEQPQHHIFRDDGPTIGKSARVILKAGIDGWPYPSIQWYRNGVAIPNANKPELVLNVKCELYKTYRTYRCTKCKMVSNQVPENCYHIICGNCNHKFDYKEAEQLDQAIAVIHEKERIELKELEAYNTSRQEMITSSDPKLRNMVPQIEQNIAETEQRLQILKERRNVMKKSMEFANIYRDEGLYECHIENTRGGNIVISKKSRPAVVFVEHSERYKVKVRPVYIQRAQVLRKNWTIYSSIMGTFVRGKVSGLVVVRYNDNSYYEGPYIGEEWLDGMGKVNDLGRTANHYGVYKCFDGRIFEGINVDNHFDPHNLQSFYRLTLPNGEVYEGMFCDEMYHGVGMYVYKDGSVYEGNWHKGSRFGHGHYRASASNPDGMWTYEGDWDTDRRHGEGMINFADGSCYIGEWFYEARQGMGVFISRLRDVYKGEFRDNKFHGHGELVYSDGSKYVGGFKDGMRQGRGIFSEKSGREFYGHFVDDKLNGEAIVKNIIPIETLEQDNFEVRVALYEMGDFKTWKSKYSNPMATRQFVKLFKSNREMFDSVYSMIVAKSLPDIPHGLDDRNEDVLLILEKIRSEAGQLVGQEVLEKAQKRLDDLMIPLKELKEEVAQLKDELDALSVSTVELEQSKTILTRDYKKLMREVEAERMKIEQYWHDDPTESRRKFRDACKQLSKVTKDEYFLFKNHRVPPPFVRKILDAICILLNMDIDSWKKQQMIVSDAVFNARMADDAALRYDYSCKLDHMMNHKTSTYDVFDYIGVFKSPHYDHLINILTDPRFRKDSYYVESCGVAAPFLVEWVYCNVAYLRAGRLVQDLLERSRKNFISASRMLKNHQFKDEQQASVLARIKIARQEYTKKKLDLSDLEEAVVKAKDMIRFVTESYNFGNKRKVVLDYYEQLEKKMEAEKDQLDVESALEALKKGVIDEHEFLIKERAKEARARGEAYSPPAIVAPQLMHDIMEEVTFQQDAIISDGECVGYTLEPVPNTISPERTKQITKQICEMIMGLMNSTFHEIPINRRWVSMKGKVLTPRFLYIIIWKIWKDIATERENAKAIAGWEEIFGPDPRACAVMAIQARVNWRMSEVARKQSKIWALKYPKEVELAEQQLSEEFSELFTTDIAAQAMEISEDETGVHGPEIKSQALCWIKYHPSIFNKEKDSRAAKMAKEFQKTYSKNSASMAFKIINGLLGPDADEYKWHDHATHWVSFHRDGYDKDTAVIVANLAKKFADKHPAKTAIDAVTVIHNEEVSKYIVDPEVYKEYSQEPDQYFSARCWGLLNQGLLRGARETVTRERNATLKRMWNELEVATEEFRKGSYLYTPEEMKYTPSKDRFVGFRNRLSNKYGYLYGCLLMQANDLWKEMENLEVNDPLTKVAHNIRPSEAEQKERMEADNYIKEKNAAENAYNEVSSKLSIWNTYFGTEEEKQYYIDNPEPEAY